MHLTVHQPCIKSILHCDSAQPLGDLMLRKSFGKASKHLMLEYTKAGGMQHIYIYQSAILS